MFECGIAAWSSIPISNDPFGPLRLRFLARCADQLAELKAAREGGPSSGRSADDPLVRIAHSLAGAGGTFGFPDISARASELERLRIGQADAAETGPALDALIAEIERALD
ncbi:histidine phosphotransferase [Mesorhizobium waimense]|uniref:Histidine phosphotransferase n=1 Tax=Mesorhizobium waimense TaxID=1300307 RepID=A0A3A5KE20_9HYPH|nr:histidine phosphotransferase [Mesorhizobium waimense]